MNRCFLIQREGRRRTFATVFSSVATEQLQETASQFIHEKVAFFIVSLLVKLHRPLHTVGITVPTRKERRWASHWWQLTPFYIRFWCFVECASFESLEPDLTPFRYNPCSRGPTPIGANVSTCYTLLFLKFSDLRSSLSKLSCSQRNSGMRKNTFWFLQFRTAPFSVQLLVRMCCIGDKYVKNGSNVCYLHISPDIISM